MDNNKQLEVSETVYYLDFAMAGNVMVAHGNVKQIMKWPQLDSYLVCTVTENECVHGQDFLSNRLYRTREEAVKSLSQNAELLKLKYIN
jgi:hypothetical protein